MGKIWLITGSGNGLGRDIAEAASDGRTGTSGGAVWRAGEARYAGSAR
jgi:NAD(P)-dependent dehydrogenase (short-subunit alcohol dehydrogenase family)